MTFEIVTVPCRADNYAFLVHDPSSGRTALVDAPEASPVEAALEARGWGLEEIWITHHHADHVDGVAALRARYGSEVTGARTDAHRLPPLDRAVADGDRFDFAGADVEVLDVSGHTLGHVAFHIPSETVVFTADSLMAMGCGRVFEGTPEMMWKSLSRLAALPGDTVVCSGHEYTATNARFALTIEPENADLKDRAEAVFAAEAAGKPTVPSTLSQERATNPFLRAGLPVVKSSLNMCSESDAAVFAEIRGLKDRF